MANNYPQVTKQTVIGFGKAWDRGGIKMILDDTSIQFAMDFANVCMRSYVDDIKEDLAIAAKVKAALAAKAQAAPQAGPVTTGEGTAELKPKSTIILTD